MLYESGQAHRFDEPAINTGVAGIMRCLQSLGMVDAGMAPAPPTRVFRRTLWVRARRGGLVRVYPGLGDRVERGEAIAEISDAFGYRPTAVKATDSGWVIGRSLNPQVSPGDALVHVAVADGSESHQDPVRTPS